jgi:hypothetical protein
MSEIRTNSITDVSGTGTPNFPNGLAFVDGSATAPSITNIGDTNTGIYFPSADVVGVSTGGAIRATFTSTGLSLYTPQLDVNGNSPSFTLINNMPSRARRSHRIRQPKDRQHQRALREVRFPSQHNTPPHDKTHHPATQHDIRFSTHRDTTLHNKSPHNTTPQ